MTDSPPVAAHTIEPHNVTASSSMAARRAHHTAVPVTSSSARLPLPLLLVLVLVLAATTTTLAWRLPSSSSSPSTSRATSSRSRITPPLLGRAGQRTRRFIWPTPEEEEEMEWPRPLEKDAEELRKQQGLGSPGGKEDGAEEALPTILVDGEPQKVRYQPTLSISEDLWPVLTATWKSITLLAPEGTKRRSAQMTILSVGAMGLGSLLLFLALLPAGFIHGPTDARTVAARPTYGTKTYINPDKVLEEDFYRAGGVYMWDDFTDEDEY